VSTKKGNEAILAALLHPQTKFSSEEKGNPSFLTLNHKKQSDAAVRDSNVKTRNLQKKAYSVNSTIKVR